MVSGTRGPIPITPEAQFSEWRNLVDYRLKALEGGAGDKKGIVARQDITSSAGPYSGNATTDFALPNVAASADRYYRVHLHSKWTVDAGSVWDINFHVGSTLTDQMGHINTAGAISDKLSAAILWLPSSGTFNLSIRLVKVSGTVNLTFNGASTAIRWFWVEDIGMR